MTYFTQNHDLCYSLSDFLKKAEYSRVPGYFRSSIEYHRVLKSRVKSSSSCPKNGEFESSIEYLEYLLNH